MAIKKQQTQIESAAAFYTLDSVPKAGMLDLVVDLLRQRAGDESLDGEELIAAFREAYEPIAKVRGERLPKTWTPGPYSPKTAPNGRR